MDRIMETLHLRDEMQRLKHERERGAADRRKAAGALASQVRKMVGDFRRARVHSSRLQEAGLQLEAESIRHRVAQGRRETVRLMGRNRGERMRAAADLHKQLGQFAALLHHNVHRTLGAFAAENARCRGILLGLSGPTGSCMPRAGEETAQCDQTPEAEDVHQAQKASRNNRKKGK